MTRPMKEDSKMDELEQARSQERQAILEMVKAYHATLDNERDIGFQGGKRLAACAIADLIRRRDKLEKGEVCE